MNLVLATNNRHKYDEIRQIFIASGLKDVVLYLPEQVIGKTPIIEETADTLEENAELKAVTINFLTGMPAIGDDTGLEIEALDNAPGVLSARFAGEHGNDSLNRLKVLDLLKDVPVEKRKARFRTVICFATEVEVTFHDGICTGRIINEERGEGGFGYDSIFLPDGFDMTFAEMTPEMKNSISHRFRAINNLLDFIKKGKF